MQFFLKTLLFFCLALQNSFGASSSSQNHQLSGAKTALIASFYEQNGVQKLVAGVEFQLQEGWKILKRHGLTEDEAVMHNHREGLYYTYDYTRDISLSWPLILENKIDLRFDLDEEGTCTAGSPIGLCCYDKNPLRAAMLVFLMMKEQENEI